MSENFSENPCNQPKRLFFLDFSIVFAKFSPLPRLPFFSFACIMRVFHARCQNDSRQQGGFSMLSNEAIHQQVETLLSQMTLEEKAAQMVQVPYTVVGREEALRWAKLGAGFVPARSGRRRARSAAGGAP